MGKHFQITILVDNQAPPRLTAEHGLSLWIKAEDRNILFDTGQGGALIPNALTLGVDLAETDFLVLSHGHYDHAGGIPRVLKVARHVELYCHPGAVQPRYSIRNKTSRSIQMQRDTMAAIERLPAERLHWVSRPLLLFGKVGVTGPIPRETGYEDVGGPFYLDPEGRRVDLIEDDLALWIQTDQGVVVCVGCCHAGLVNTLRYVQRLSNDSRIRAIIGGFHLLNASSQRLNQTITALRSMELDMVIPCHCTGRHAVTALRDALGERVSPGAAGQTYRF